MAPKMTAVLTILLMVSLVSADPIRAQQLGGSERQELMENGSGGDGGMVAGGVFPTSNCNEEALYHGPCVDLLCTAACILQMNRGGHCKGGFFSACLCFVCS